MQQTKLVNLPIIGRVQHGEKIKNKVIEYGYFIAKSDDEYMKSYLDKFNKLFKGKQNIEIEFFDEDPLSKKYVRYNQSGEVCRSPEGSNKANQRVKNGWQQINCDTYNCQYRQKNEHGKCACNRIGWLKFLIPDVSTDRIFLMKITGQTSINKLDDYIKLQKAQGKSIKGRHIIFLKQIEQSNSLGQTFNNYVLDILKKENVESIKQIPETTENPKELSTNNDKNVNNAVVNSNTTPPSSTVAQEVTQTQEIVETPKEETTIKTTKKPTTKDTTKKETKSKSKKTDDKPKDTKTQETSVEDDNFKNCYALLSTFNEKIADRDYLIGEFADMKDQISNIAIRPEDATELEKCDLGTFVRLDVAEIKGRKFAVKLEFIEKTLKKVAA